MERGPHVRGAFLVRRKVCWRVCFPHGIVAFAFFGNYDIRATPKVVAGNIEYDRSYTGKRLRALRDAGLLIQDDEGFYTLSDLGRDFLADDIERKNRSARPDKDDEDA